VVVASVTPVVVSGQVRCVIGGYVAMNSVMKNIQSILPTPFSFGVLVDKKEMSLRILPHR